MLYIFLRMAFLRRGLQSLRSHRGWQFTTELHVVLLSSATYTIFAVGYTLWRPISINRAIDSALKSGTKPKQLMCDFAIDRSEEIERIKSLFIAEPTSPNFGVVLGPSGTGKTYASRAACNERPDYILYHEIISPYSAPEELAKVAGMPVRPSFGDRFFCRFTSSEIYLGLPEDRTKALVFVLNKVAERSKKFIFKKTTKYLPCFVIDGSDLLAKEDERSFIKLVDLAKRLANENRLRIIFVSSEGHVLSLLESTSSNSRAEVVEVLDLSSEKAEKFLTDNKIKDPLAKTLARITGGRVLNLLQTAHFCKRHPEFDEAQVTEQVEERMNRATAYPMLEVGGSRPLSIRIMACVFNKGPMKPCDIHQELYLETKELTHSDVKEVVTRLVKANLFRYQANCTITWHSSIVEKEVRRMYGGELK